jgi:hypothetical protein
MADREQPQKPGTHEKSQRDIAGTSGGTVGRDVPDLSKERNTEIAIEAGEKGSHPEDKPIDDER